MKTPSQRQRKRKLGFTLVEIMLVIVIIGLILAVAVPNIISYGHDARIMNVHANINALKTALARYELKKGQYPNSLEEIANDFRDGLPKDPWGRAYVYRKTEGDYELYSTGKSGSEKITGKEE